MNEMKPPDKISVIIPAYNEKKNLEVLIPETAASLAALTDDFEIIVVDDGSEDGTAAFVKQAAASDPRIKGIVFRRNFGKSAALEAGFRKASGDVVITMDADLQDDPAAIPDILRKLEEGFDLICCWRKDRKDDPLKKLASWVYNLVTAAVSGITIHDFNCGFKAYRKALLKEIHVYGELHRYIPLLAGRSGYKIAELPVKHRKRGFGKSKYGLGRFISGFYDLLTAFYITRYRKKPSRLFYSLGGSMLLVGFLINTHILFIKLSGGILGPRIVYIMAGIILTLSGIQLICTGLLVEYINNLYHKYQKEYSIEEAIL